MFVPPIVPLSPSTASEDAVAFILFVDNETSFSAVINSVPPMLCASSSPTKILFVFLIVFVLLPCMNVVASIPMVSDLLSIIFTSLLFPISCL